MADTPPSTPVNRIRRRADTPNAPIKRKRHCGTNARRRLTFSQGGAPTIFNTYPPGCTIAQVNSSLPPVPSSDGEVTEVTTALNNCSI